MRHALTFRGQDHAIPAGKGLCTRCGRLLDVEQWLAEACTQEGPHVDDVCPRDGRVEGSHV